MGPADAGQLFGLRRAALADSPFSFSASLEDDVWSSENAVQEQMQRVPGPVVFGAIATELVGMLGIGRAGKLKERHRAHIWGVYVHPQWRGRGIAGQLIEAAIAHARTLDGVDSLHLSVNETTPGAQRVYERYGFKIWGAEPDALRYGGRSTTEYHMVRALKAGA
jgi:ribosomal protein S18 acetylase RimI-like enzyme